MCRLPQSSGGRARSPPTCRADKRGALLGGEQRALSISMRWWSQQSPKSYFVDDRLGAERGLAAWRRARQSWVAAPRRVLGVRALPEVTQHVDLHVLVQVVVPTSRRRPEWRCATARATCRRTPAAGMPDGGCDVVERNLQLVDDGPAGRRRRLVVRRPALDSRLRRRGAGRCCSSRPSWPCGHALKFFVVPYVASASESSSLVARLRPQQREQHDGRGLPRTIRECASLCPRRGLPLGEAAGLWRSDRRRGEIYPGEHPSGSRASTCGRSRRRGDFAPKR